MKTSFREIDAERCSVAFAEMRRRYQLEEPSDEYLLAMLKDCLKVPTEKEKSK